MSLRRILFCTVFALLCTLVFGDVIISEFRGKVEVRSTGGSWRAVSPGMTLALDDTISTGFGASAVLSLGTNNVIVSPLTRMTIDAFLEKENAVTTNLFLRVGSVRAQVDDSGAKKQSFNITSPYSTASVRGTEFSFDGLNLQVFKGSVALFLGLPIRTTQSQLGPNGESDGGDGEGGDDGSGEGDGGSGDGEGDTGGSGSGGILVGAGETLQLDIDFTAGGTITPTITDRGSDFTTDPSSNGAGGGDGGSGDGDSRGPAPDPVVPRANTGGVDITWEWEESE